MLVEGSFCYRVSDLRLSVRAWVEDGYANTQALVLTTASTIEVIDERGVVLVSSAAALDPAGSEYVAFDVIVVLALSHAYIMRVRLVSSLGAVFRRDFPRVVTP